jgi:hypothetical protein
VTADAILVIAWLVLAHLVADFVLQTSAIAGAKSGRGVRALLGLLGHGLMVMACLIPLGIAFGDRGWWLVALTGVTHVVIDRTKVALTRRAAAAALREAHERHEGPQPPEHLGRAWTPRPAALFLADQAAHLAIAGAGWAVFLAGHPLSSGWVGAIDGWLGGWDRAAVHDIVSLLVVGVALAILNVRTASLFVGILVRPVEVSAGGEHRWGSRAAPAVGAGPAVDAQTTPAAAMRRWTVRIGPLDARVTADADPPPTRTGDAGRGDPSATGGSRPDGASVAATVAVHGSARVGSTIGILERILIVVFVLTGSDVAIGFVVGAKTLARFKLLDDRDFAEYYLLGTLASVGFAIISGLVARAALNALLA